MKLNKNTKIRYFCTKPCYFLGNLGPILGPFRFFTNLFFLLQYFRRISLWKYLKKKLFLATDLEKYY